MYDYSEKDLSQCLRAFVPEHPDLELMSVSEQRLNRTTSRILVTMQQRKTKRKNPARNDNKQKQQQTTSTKKTNVESIESLETSTEGGDVGERRTSTRLNEFRDKYFSPKN